jgi:hypothetical protein
MAEGLPKNDGKGFEYGPTRRGHYRKPLKSVHPFVKGRLFEEPEYAKLSFDAEDLSTSWDFWNPPPYSL